MSESLLKKEFKEKDVQRARNIINKDFTARTTSGVGYSKKYEVRNEGDVWEESGKTWTIKDGIKQNVTKLDTAKKALRTPLRCPKCGGPMKHHLAKKMYKVHGFCFDPCTVEMEADLKKAGLYEAYEKRMITGNIDVFAKDIEQWVTDTVSQQTNFVTEDGVVEQWKGKNQEYEDKVLANIKEYLTLLRSKV